jgi:probable F420-dependent oxidoreductase
MRIGAKVPNSGDVAVERGMASMARELEDAGFSSLWVSDHVVLPREIKSRYPFAADGKATWPTDTPYFDTVVSLSVIAAATRHVVIGTAVLVLPLRHPVVFAKQAASLDVLSGGRLALGVGAGWLREEFAALDVNFESRGRRFVEWIELLRSCWSGEPDAYHGEHYELPEDVLCLPTPLHEIPLLVGGHSPVAIKRAATLGNGWLAQQSAHSLDVEEIVSTVATLRESARTRDAEHAAWTTLRLVDSVSGLDQIVESMPKLRAAGVDEIIVDIDWSDESAARETYARLAAAEAR